MIFVDLGAFDGRSSRHFESFMQPQLVTKCYMFEPNASITVKPPRCSSELIRALAYRRDGIMPIHLDNMNGLGSSIFSDKQTGDLSEQGVLVDCIDLSRWLYAIDTHGTGGPVHIKMNVEGAEYPIIEHLEYAGIPDYVEALYISWHHTKIPCITQRRHDE